MREDPEGVATQRLLDVIRGREPSMERNGEPLEPVSDRARVRAEGADRPEGPILTPPRKARAWLPGRVRVGLDIGHQAVKMVQMERTSRGFRLLRMGLAEVAPSKESPESRLEAQGEAARTLLQDVQPRRDLVVTSLSDSGIVIRQTTLPRMPPKDLAQAVPFEARKHMPYDPARVLLRYQVVAEDRKAATCQVLLVAVPQEAYQRHKTLLARLGLDPYAVEVGPLALANAALLPPERSPETVVVLDVGAVRSVLALRRSGGVFFCRQLSISGDTFTREIQSALNLSYGEAEALKRGKSGREDPGPGGVLDAARPAVDGLLLEIRRSLAYYDNLTGRYGFSRLMLSGGGALFPGLPSALEESLGIPVRPVNPFVGIQGDPEQEAREWIQDALPLWTQAVGLATRR